MSASKSTQTRAKYAYLKYDSMIANLSDETLNPKQKLDAYDINFAPDTKECYVIAPDLTPWAIKSKVYTFDNVQSANEKLNANTDTYPGQIVAIQFEEKYFGYIVNQNSDGFYVSPLSEHENGIDYNDLGNRPIINLVGTLDAPILVSSLNTGIYKVKGQYKVTELEETIYLSASDTIFIVNNNSETINVKKITTDNIINYEISNDKFTSTIYITDDYLTENNYATKPFVDEKIEAAKLILEDELKVYVVETINSVMDEELDKKIDERIDAFIQPTDNNQINELFS